MKNKIKSILLTIFISSLVLLLTPSTVLAAICNSSEEIGTVSISRDGAATLSGAIADYYNSADSGTKERFKTGSNFYYVNGAYYVCVTSSKNAPPLGSSGTMYRKINGDTWAYNGHDGTQRFGGYTYSQIASGISSYIISNRRGGQNYYIIGHAILSGIMNNDWTLYTQIHSISNAGPAAIESFVDAVISSVSSKNACAPYY